MDEQSGTWSIGGEGGGFTHLHVFADGTLNLDNDLVGGKIKYKHNGLLTKYGQIDNTLISLNGVKSLNPKLSLSPIFSYSNKSFKLERRNQSIERSINSIRTEIASNSIDWGRGRWSNYFAFNNWKLSDTYDVSGYDLNVVSEYSADAGPGHVHNRLEYNAEPISQGNDNLRLLQLTSDYYFSTSPVWGSSVGIELGLGKDPWGLSRNFAGLRIQSNLRIDDMHALHLILRQGGSFESIYSLNRLWWMADSSSRGTIIETPVFLKLNVERVQSEKIEFGIAFEYAHNRHNPFIVPAGDGWTINTRTLRLFKGSVACSYRIDEKSVLTGMITSNTASTAGTGLGSSAPQIAPVQILLSAQTMLNSWELGTELTWRSKAPLDYQDLNVSPARIIGNITVSRDILPDLRFHAGMENMFNSHYFDIQSYDKLPFWIYCGITYNGIF